MDALFGPKDCFLPDHCVVRSRDWMGMSPEAVLQIFFMFNGVVLFRSYYNYGMGNEAREY